MLTYNLIESSMDIDDYINDLVKQNESFKSMIESLKNEIRTQRQEISLLREERRLIIDKGSNIITWKENNNND
jgi:hypothetical protein